MDKRTALIAGSVVTLAFILAIGTWFFVRGSVSDAIYRAYEADPDPYVVTLIVNGHNIDAELVVTEEDIRQGLSDRESLERDRGMLFELGRRDIHPFWMNRMHFPLDIIWIDGNVVVEIAERLPPPKFGEIPFTYTPKVDADRVLEVNAGVVKATGLKVGDEIGGLTETQK